MVLATSHSQSCPFCSIAAAYPPTSNPVPTSPPPSTNDTSTTTSPPDSPVAYLLLSTPHLLAFLDHAPISRGHVLVATRQHREKLSDASVEETAAVGAWLGIISRAVIGVVDPQSVVGNRGSKAVGQGVGGGEGDQPGGESRIGDWNVVQNNGTSPSEPLLLCVQHAGLQLTTRVVL